MKIVEKEEVAKQSDLTSINPNPEEKKKLVEPVKAFNVQAAINIAMQRVDEISKEKMVKFVSWVTYQIVIHLEVIRRENNGQGNGCARAKDVAMGGNKLDL